MIEATVDITTADGPMETFYLPSRTGWAVSRCVLSDGCPWHRRGAPGHGRRLATVGYYVLLPNLYYRAGRDTIFGPDVSETGSPEYTRMRAVRTTMTIPPVMQDVAAMLAFVDRQEAVTPGAVGCHGYCMSGPYALAAAARYPHRIAAAASFYGPGWSARRRRARIARLARSRANSISPVPSTTHSRRCLWSKNCKAGLHGQAWLVRSKCTRGASRLRLSTTLVL